MAAFDHRHVFLDPDPDPEASFAERTRLFGLPRFQLGRLRRSLISPGGGVFPGRRRRSRSPRRSRPGWTFRGALTPDELIRAILRAPVDLLWNGGVGTYVKASAETHADVGDKRNDQVRIDAGQLRCRVVGEGGNLGFTQRGRVEFALAGGRINTDAIDNSAGVDCSDHEVNIKILLDRVVADGDLTGKQRDALLVEMTDEVAELVLADNAAQTRALYNARAQAHAMLDVHVRYLHALERSGRLNRALEFLPTDDELAERAAAGGGLVMPEFAVLLAYSKIWIYDELLASELPEDAFLSAELADYFPTAVRERYADRLTDHPLRREIIATRVTNALVNRAGTTFAFRLAEEIGLPSRTSPARTSPAGRSSGWPSCRPRSRRWPTSRPRPRSGSCSRCGRWPSARAAGCSATAASRWTSAARSSTSGRPSRCSPTRSRGCSPARTTRTRPSAARSPASPRTASRRRSPSGWPRCRRSSPRWTSSTWPPRPVATWSRWPPGLLRLDQHLQLDWLRERILRLPRDDRWQTLARAALRDDLYAVRASLTAEVLQADGDGDDLNPHAR